MSSTSVVPCPACGAAIAAELKSCPSCGAGVARVRLRARIQGHERVFEQRVACDLDEVEFLDGAEAEIENPEELPGRES